MQPTQLYPPVVDLLGIEESPQRPKQQATRCATSHSRTPRTIRANLDEYFRRTERVSRPVSAGTQTADDDYDLGMLFGVDPD
jgi:hypothetical protein